LILGDEAIIRHVEEDTQKRVDLRAFQCWATCRDPSKIPQSVFLSLSKFEANPRRAAQAHLNRPREALHSHVFRVLVHIDAVEDLMFYHFPREDLIADGKRPWTNFCWQYGRANGDLEEWELHPPTRYCEQEERQGRRRPRDDDDDWDREQFHRSMSRGLSNRRVGDSYIRGRSR
jgi:hypothetical protein